MTEEPTYIYTSTNYYEHSGVMNHDRLISNYMEEVPSTLVLGVEIHPDDLVNSSKEIEFKVFRKVNSEWVLRMGFTWAGGADAINPWVNFRPGVLIDDEIRIVVNNTGVIRYKLRWGMI